MHSYDVCECGAPLQRMERETPQPKGSDVVLKVLAAGVCHSDLHIWDGYYELGGGQKLKLGSRREAAAGATRMSARSSPSAPTPRA